MRRALIVFMLMAVATIAVSFAVGEVLSQPVNGSIGTAPIGLNAESIVLPVSPDESVSGWVVRGNPGGGVVLLLHGVRSNRRQMAGRAISLHKEGYSVVLIDLPAHGESRGKHITFGHRESAGVHAAIEYIGTAFSDEKVGVIGVSLGAASLLLTDLPREPDAMVLESMYSTIEEAVSNRLTMRVGTAGAILAPLLLWQLPPRLGITPDRLRPIDRLPDWYVPVLIASGEKDKHTTQEETRRLFDRANTPKQLWIVPGAGHVDLYRFATKEYKAIVYGFLQQHLRDKALDQRARTLVEAGVPDDY